MVLVFFFLDQKGLYPEETNSYAFLCPLAAAGCLPVYIFTD